MVFNFLRFKFYPPGPVQACQGRPQLQQGRQQGRPQLSGRLRLQPAAAGAAAGAVALLASGGFPLLSLAAGSACRLLCDRDNNDVLVEFELGSLWKVTPV